MEWIILVAVTISILFAIASGVWVAVSLVRAISTSRAEQAVRRQGDEENANEDI